MNGCPEPCGTDAAAPTVHHFHVNDHSGVLAPLPEFDAAAPPGLGAIVVPSHRAARKLRSAVRLAKSLDAPILVLTTAEWGAAGSDSPKNDDRTSSGIFTIAPRCPASLHRARR